MIEPAVRCHQHPKPDHLRGPELEAVINRPRVSPAMDFSHRYHTSAQGTALANHTGSETQLVHHLPHHLEDTGQPSSVKWHFGWGRWETSVVKRFSKDGHAPWRISLNFKILFWIQRLLKMEKFLSPVGPSHQWAQQDGGLWGFVAVIRYREINRPNKFVYYIFKPLSEFNSITDRRHSVQVSSLKYIWEYQIGWNPSNWKDTFLN